MCIYERVFVCVGCMCLRESLVMYVNVCEGLRLMLGVFFDFFVLFIELGVFFKFRVY